MIEIRDILMDLENAINSAELTEVEMAVIRETYINVPMTPIRSGKPGRPKKAGQQGLIAMTLRDMFRSELGTRGWKNSNETEYHDLHRSIKQYKKTLQRALCKIDTALNYGGTLELSASALRYMPTKYITQV